MPFKHRIKVYYRSVDHFSQSRSFATLDGARKYAQLWVSERPEVSMGYGYAVSPDGVGKVTCEGCLISDLFPALFPQPSADSFDW